MARPSTTPVGLRLPPALLERINAKAAELGTNRSALIVLALNQFLDGAPVAAPAPVGVPSTSVVDQPAREALLTLKGRVKALEQWKKDVEAGNRAVMEMERLKEEALAQQAEALKDDFADQFARS